MYKAVKSGVKGTNAYVLDIDQVRELLEPKWRARADRTLQLLLEVSAALLGPPAHGRDCMLLRPAIRPAIKTRHQTRRSQRREEVVPPPEVLRMRRQR